jgi:glutaconate CoA-transferase subunit A
MLGRRARQDASPPRSKAGSITIRDATCPAIHAGLQAAEKGIPFMPLRGILGSDLIGRQPVGSPWTIPMAMSLAASAGAEARCRALHVPLADRAGNVWIGRRRGLATMAHAARVTS